MEQPRYKAEYICRGKAIDQQIGQSFTCQDNNGIAILVNRTDNLLFQEIIFPKAKSMLFMRRRVKFLNPNGESRTPMFGSVLVAFGDECDRRLRKSNIEGKYVILN